MLHPDTEIRFINESVGYGVVATRLIPKGTITWVQDPLDRVFSPLDVARLPAMAKRALDTYGFRNALGETVLCWDAAKYVNHSFRPSCFSTAYDFEMAIRDIAPGEQLTDDYGYLNVAAPFHPVDEGTERKVVYPDDLFHFYAEWDALLHKNLHHLFRVPQPLSALLPAATQKELSLLEHEPGAMRSILGCWYPEGVAR
ncbi:MULTISPECIES: SET domain-containing protein [unclassified Flavobacterium]|uniref:SET domain-containing protein n=1 Tax=unclassified Flavobacterium TaxID=196869 RepID=UPI001F14696D|nr:MULTISPECIES: SET domain-containing protein [unclassified Flavobacterium]UMY64756.1 SET domain-containing protein [Flavobacterium sp. HJ-32-4]